MDLVTEFHNYVTSMIDETGVYPLPGMTVDRAGQLTIAALCDVETSLTWFWHQVTFERATK